MAIEFTPDDVASGYNLTKLNGNFDKIDVALQDALSRSGQTPNQMEADIDLNNNDLLNVNVLNAEAVYSNGTLLIPGDVVQLPAGSIDDSLLNPSIYATESDAEIGTNTTKLMTPARVKDAIEDLPVTLDVMSNPEKLEAIINRTGLTPQMVGAQVSDTNHSSFINTAIDRLITAGGGTLWLPPMSGDYKIGTTINLHKTGVTASYLQVKGVGQKARLRWLNTTGDMFIIGDGTNPVYYVTLENLYLYQTGTPRTSGIDIKARKANFLWMKDIVTDGTYAGFEGEDLNSVYGNMVHFNMPNATTGVGVRVFSNPAGSGRTDIVKWDELTIQAFNAGSRGIQVEGRVAGFHTDGAYMLGTQRGLHLFSSSSALADIPQFCDFNKFETDRALDISVVIDKAYRTEFRRCEISNTSGAPGQGNADSQAMFLGAGSIDTKILGGRIGNCRTHALEIQGKNTKVIGTSLTDMSKAGIGAASGIFIASTANGVNLSDLTVEGYSRAQYAVNFDAAAKNGKVRDTLYKDVTSSFSNAVPATFEVTGSLLVDYTY